MATWGDEAGVVHVALEKQSQHRLVLRGRDLSDLLDLAVRAIRARAQCLQRARPALLLDVEHRPARSRRRWALRLDDGTLFTVTTTAAYAVRAVRAGV